MLFKEIHLKGIKSGEITLAFRKWKKALVKERSLIHTSIGLIEIQKIKPVTESDITDKSAVKAGYEDKSELLKSFSPKITGTIYKISVGYHSADPRIKLREQSELTETQYNELKKKLKSFDKHSNHRHWTKKVLLAIKDNPNLHAIGIAKLTGFEKDWLKPNIRKLKNLGLTISHKVGYELSPLGKAFMHRIKAEE